MLKKISLIAGIFLVVLIAFVAEKIQFLPFWPFSMGFPAKHPIEPVLIVILLGILINNVIKVPKIFDEGVEFCGKKLLPIAIILLGARLHFQDMLAVSVSAILISVACIVITFIITIWLCQRANIDKALSILIAMGTAICGSAAILVAAPVITASKKNIAIAITVINLFGLIAIFLFPLLGHLLNMTDTAFGLWAGTSIQAVPQAVAASFAFGEQAGAIGTITKLMRVLFLAPMIIALSFWQNRKFSDGEKAVSAVSWKSYIPPFILGFIALIIINSFGWLPVTTTVWLTKLSSFLLTMALAAIGLKVNLLHLIKGGLKPLVIAGLSALILAFVSWILIQAFIVV